MQTESHRTGQRQKEGIFLLPYDIVHLRYFSGQAKLAEALEEV